MNTQHAGGKTEQTGRGHTDGLRLAWRFAHRETVGQMSSERGGAGRCPRWSECLTEGPPAELAARWHAPPAPAAEGPGAADVPRKVPLRDRRMGRWMAAYVALAWVALQGVNLLAEIWSWSQLCQQVSSIVLGAGVFPAAVVAWYHGERGRQSVCGEEIALLAGAIMGLVFTVWTVCFAGLG